MSVLSRPGEQCTFFRICDTTCVSFSFGTFCTLPSPISPGRFPCHPSVSQGTFHFIRLFPLSSGNFPCHPLFLPADQPLPVTEQFPLSDNTIICLNVGKRVERCVTCTGPVADWCKFVWNIRENSCPFLLFIIDQSLYHNGDQRLYCPNGHHIIPVILVKSI